MSLAATPEILTPTSRRCSQTSSDVAKTEAVKAAPSGDPGDYVVAAVPAN